MRVARHIAERIASGAGDPIEGARDLVLIRKDHTGGDELAVFAALLDDYEYPGLVMRWGGASSGPLAG